jgi:nitrogen fixation NifU-like protein
MASATAIYQQAIMQLAAEAVGHGTLAAASASTLVDNPLCGDRVEMQIETSAGRIAALAHRVKGCLLCRAAASVIGKQAIGASRDEIEQVAVQLAQLLRDGAPAPRGWESLSAFAPVHGHPSRYRCVELPFEALRALLGTPPSATPPGG